MGEELGLFKFVVDAKTRRGDSEVAFGSDVTLVDWEDCWLSCSSTGCDRVALATVASTREVLGAEVSVVDGDTSRSFGVTSNGGDSSSSLRCVGDTASI